MSVRLTQIVLENLSNVISKIRKTQVSLEGLYSVFSTKARKSQISLEGLYSVVDTKARKSQVSLEVLFVEQRPARVTQVTTELLVIPPKIDEFTYSVQCI